LIRTRKVAGILNLNHQLFSASLSKEKTRGFVASPAAPGL